MKKLFLVLIVLVMILGACTPAVEEAPAEQPAAEEVEEAEVEEAEAEEVEEAEAEEVEEAEAEEVEEAEAEEAPAEETGGTITIGMEAIMFQLDPMATSALNASMIFENMFDSLLTMNEDTLELNPHVAKDWSVSDDGLTWTFNLRDDVYFWDGELLDAADVKYTLDRMRDKEMGFTGNTNYLNSMMKVVDTAVVDEDTVSVTTEVTVPALIYFLEEVYLMPEHYYGDLSGEEAAAADPLGSGPYVFSGYEKDASISMTANPDYFLGETVISDLVWRVIPEASTRVAELATGGVDLIQAVPVSKYDEVRGMDGVELKPVVSGCRQVFWPNHNDPRFEDARVRQAVNHMIDWDLVSEVFFNGTVPRMVINVNPPWLNEDLEPYAYDTALAAQLMEEAGWTKNADGIYEKDGVVMEFPVLTYYDANSERVEIMIALLAMLRENGINATAEPTERSVAFAKMDAHDIGPMLFAASCSSFEGEGDIHDLAGDSVTNYGEYQNEDFNAILKEVGMEFDPGKRAELLDAAQVIAYEDAAQIWLFNLPMAFATGPRLDYDPIATGRIHLIEGSYK